MAQLHPVSALLRNDLALTVHSRRYFTPVVWRGELHSLKRPGSLFSNMYPNSPIYMYVFCVENTLR